jgi:nucleoside-diphosphate-sugar epimerase
MSCPTILVTGVTGFLGGATAAALLRRPEPLRLLLLVRADGPEHAEARARRSLARFAEADRPAFAWDRCTFVPADLTEPASLAARRLDAATHVLHLAANTSFRSVRGVRAVNVDGTVALAQRMQSVPGLARFVHVGTAFICGAHPSRVVGEDDYPRPEAEHLVEYTRSKAEAELLLDRLTPPLPLVVARPSIVVGHTRLGCAPSASIFWYYRAVDLLRRVPAPLDTRKDIVPVDYVADALIHLLFQPALRERRYHISAGEASAVSWREMAAVLARYHGQRPENPYRVVDHRALCRERGRLAQMLGPGDEERLLQALEGFFRFSACGVEIFDNRRLLAEGVPAPPRFTDYLPVCIERPAGRSVYEQMRDDA